MKQKVINIKIRLIKNIAEYDESKKCLYLEPFDFTNSPSIGIRGYGDKSSILDGWKLSSSSIDGKPVNLSAFSPYSLLFNTQSTLDGVKKYVENKTYTLKDIIKDAKDADDKNVSLDQYWTSHIGKKPHRVL